MGGQAIWLAKPTYRSLGGQATRLADPTYRSLAGQAMIWLADPTHRSMGGQAIQLANPPTGQWVARQSGWPTHLQVNGWPGNLVGQPHL